jgi:hypothetical protein
MAMAAPETVVAADRALYPATVFCAPLYGSAGHLSRTLESLTGQSCRDFALVLVDDRSPDHTLEVAHAFAERDPRISLFRNAERLGLLRNTVLAHRLGRRLYPGAGYLAYASDHDVWHPHWLARLREELEAAPEAVLAYPRVNLIAENGDEAPSRTRDFETRGERDPGARFYAVHRRMIAGDMIYGLFRAGALCCSRSSRCLARSTRFPSTYGAAGCRGPCRWNASARRSSPPVAASTLGSCPGGRPTPGPSSGVTRSRARRWTLVHAPPPWHWPRAMCDARRDEPGSGRRREGCGARDGDGGALLARPDGAARNGCAAA